MSVWFVFEDNLHFLTQKAWPSVFHGSSDKKESNKMEADENRGSRKIFMLSWPEKQNDLINMVGLLQGINISEGLQNAIKSLEFCYTNILLDLDLLVKLPYITTYKCSKLSFC